MSIDQFEWLRLVNLLFGRHGLTKFTHLYEFKFFRRSGILILVHVVKLKILASIVWIRIGFGQVERRSTLTLCRPWTSRSLEKPGSKETEAILVRRSIFMFCLSSSIRKWCANVWFPCICYKFSSIFDFCTIHHREWGWCRYFGHFCSLWMHLHRSLLIQIARKYLRNGKRVLLGAS